MLFKWEIETLWGVQIGRIGPAHHMEYFLLFFWKFFYMVTLMKKLIWEIRNALESTLPKSKSRFRWIPSRIKLSWAIIVHRAKKEIFIRHIEFFPSHFVNDTLLRNQISVIPFDMWRFLKKVCEIWGWPTKLKFLIIIWKKCAQILFEQYFFIDIAIGFNLIDFVFQLH